jgi:threonylcarbamoyladenosine tRNA methylthiotransferase MtaB
MNRRYLSDKVIEAVRRLRAARGDPFVGADLIVGFPGETEGDFQRTYAMVQQLQFAGLHVFPFSARPGTTAALMRPVVPERVRHDRATRLAALSRRLSASYAERWVGKDVEVVLENKAGVSAYGVTGNYLKVFIDGVPLVSGTIGRVVRAKVTNAGRQCRGRFLGFVD